MNKVFVKIMDFFDDIIDIFRKKEYYVIDYDLLNNYSIEFKEIQEEDLKRIQSIILKFQEAEQIDDSKANLYKDKAHIYLDIKELIREIKRTVHQDYRKTYFEAAKENWDFNYFLTSSDMIYNDVLLISNRLQDKSGEIGEIMYPVLAIKKHSQKYYLWNLLDDKED